MRPLVAISSYFEIGVFAVVFLWYSAALGSVTIDDAFISFRYAYNLIHFGIWNYNPDHEYVEAYTSVLYTVLALVPIAVGLSPVIFFKLLGGTLLLRFVWVAQSLCPDRVTRVALLAFILCNPNLYIHAYGCLETMLFMVLCLEVYAVLLRGKISRCFYVLLLLLPLTRPEGAFIAVAAFGLYVCRHRSVPHVHDLVAVAVVGALYFVWRCAYFGYLLPNTYYAKLALSTPDTVKDNATNIVSYLWVFAVLAKYIRRWVYLGLIATVLATYAIFYLYSNLLMNYADRFAMQIFLPVLAAAVYYVREAPRKSGVVMLVLLPLLLISRVSPTELEDYLTEESEEHYSVNLIAHKLAQFRDQNLTLMVADAGANAYYSGWKTYDMVGIANETIAHYGNSPEYMRVIAPDLIFIFGQDTLALHVYQAQIVYDYIQESQKYSFVSRIMLPGERGVYYYVFLKKNIPAYRGIEQAVREVEKAAEQVHARTKEERRRWRWDYFL